MGSTATTSTITPIPPIHCVTARQNKMPGDVPSIGRSTVAPVVVNPAIDSNSARSGWVNQPVTMYGIAPPTVRTSHDRVTVVNTSCTRI